MTVRDDYAGTERRCPKCKGKFQVPTLEQARASGAAGEEAGGSIAGDDFDPVAFLTGEKPSGKGGAAPIAKAGAAGGKRPSKPDFDPMDILGGEKPPAAKSGPDAAKSPTGAGPRTPPPPADDFDPMAVLSDAPANPGTTPAPSPVALPPSPPSASSTPTAPEKPQPRRPSWAKPLPEPERKDWEEPAPPAAPAAEAPPAPTTPEKPQPKRPSWAKAAPAPEKNDWDDPAPAAAAVPAASPATTPAVPQTPQPARPSSAKPLPGGQPAAAPGGVAVAADASPAALAAAEAMAASVAAVSGDNPLLQAEAPRRPWIDPPAIAAWFRRRTPLFLRTLAFSALGFGVAWWFVAPQAVAWKVIGKSEPLAPAPVSGKITVDGKPVPNARVLFHPRGRQFRSSEGRTDADGQFDLRFCEGVPGAPPGHYRVQLQLIEANGRDAGAVAEALLRDQSFEVPPGGGTVEIALETKSKK